MNRHIFALIKTAISQKTSNWELFIWFLVHLSIPLLLFLSLFVIGPVSINTSLFDMLPQPSQSKAVMEADMILGKRNSREIIILAAAPDFENAKNGASLFYEHFMNSPDFENISFYFDPSIIAEFNQYLFDYRFVFAGSETIALLESGRAQEIAYDALASAFGAFSFFSLANIEKDPFLLAERKMGDFLTSPLFSGAMSLKEDVLAAEKDGIWYVMLRMTLSPHAVTLQADRNVVGKIYAAAPVIVEEVQGLELFFSGIPFHSYESSSGAQREISLISTITILIILLLFLFVFRSVLPVFFSVMDILISLGIAAAAALLVFREIHIITFVFGTTLIGTGVDYSVHFFAQWKKNPAMKEGAKIRGHIIKNITMSFISTQICFIVFFLAPFPILRQFAVFSMVGLLSSYLTFFCIYPRLRIPQKDKKIFTVKQQYPGFSWLAGILTRIKEWCLRCSLFEKNKKLFLRYMPLVFFGCFVIAAIVFIFLNYPSIKIENNISSLYTMSNFLLESEKKATQVLDYGSPGWYFIVSGSSVQETLENEENLVIRLNKEIKPGNLDSFLATSVFVPSVKTQQRTYQAMKALLPLAAAQFEYLGFPEQYAQAFKEEFAASERFTLIENAPSQAGISNLWIGEHKGRYYSCVLPLGPESEVIFRAIAEEFDNVYFMNKANDISRDMDILTQTMLLFFLAAYIIVSVIIFFVFPLQDSFKICSVPILLGVGALTILAINTIPIGFFSVAALVLIFGLSLDYIFFMTGKKSKQEKKLTLLAVTLSFFTTLLSFGALSFSSFMPVHLFGLTVCAGLGAAFISALILQARDNDENHFISGS